MSISEETLKHIKEKKISQRPAWHFVVESIFEWAFLITSVIIAALLIAIVIEILDEVDLALYTRAGVDPVQYLISNIPAIFIFLFIILIFFAYSEFKNSSKGYKYEKPIIITFILASISLIAFIFLSTGISKNTDDILFNLPIYQFVRPKTDDYWLHPEYGLLTGRVVQIESYNEFTLIDESGTLWHIEIASPTIENLMEVRISVKLRLTGIKYNGNIFKAMEIRAL